MPATPQPNPPPGPEGGAAPESGEAGVHRLEAQRRVNRDALAALGLNPYGQRTIGVISISLARARYDAQADAAWQALESARKAAVKRAASGEQSAPGPDEGAPDRRPVVTVAGRVMLKRDTGKLIWMQIRDHTSGAEAAERGETAAAPASGGPDASGLEPDLQIGVSARDCAAPGFDAAKSLDLGDIVVVTGPLMKTRTGEVTVWASRLGMGAKSLVPPPEKWKGLHDVEIRYRRRYIDLYANPETMRVFALRSRLASVIRRMLDDRGFMEVETPTLQALAGGAAARPFVTHLNALDIDLFMRIAPELYLKRLLVGGMPRVFEWSRNFRNEGIDRSHNPEFSMLELYEAYGDYTTMRELTEDLFRACAREVARSGAGASAGGRGDQQLFLPYGDLRIDFGSPFARISYGELFERALGISMDDSPRVLAEAKRRGLPVADKKGTAFDPILIVNGLFDVAERAIDPSRPTFVLDYPAPLCPLTRPKPGDPSVAERFELFVGGMELANAYTELNDPDVQEAKFRQQLAGLDEEEATFRHYDEDFVQALKVGMPPAGGLGVGIDRMCMVLLNQRSIRDVVLFPMMRPVE